MVVVQYYCPLANYFTRNGNMRNWTNRQPRHTTQKPSADAPKSPNLMSVFVQQDVIRFNIPLLAIRYLHNYMLWVCSLTYTTSHSPPYISVWEIPLHYFLCNWRAQYSKLILFSDSTLFCSYRCESSSRWTHAYPTGFESSLKDALRNFLYGRI
jgi:hypothetical protein